MIWMVATFLCLLFKFHATECKDSLAELHEQRQGKHGGRDTVPLASPSSTRAAAV